MISALLRLLEAFGNLALYIIDGIVSFVNLIFEVIGTAVTAFLALLPSLPAEPTIPYLAEVNWFFPIGSLISIATALVSAYGIWLGGRWILKKAGVV